MQEFYKRIKSGLWVALAGFIATLLTLIAQNIDAFKLDPTTQAIVIIFLTAVTSQITKYLNKK